jgi:hypothetical protein
MSSLSCVRFYDDDERESFGKSSKLKRGEKRIINIERSRAKENA